MLWGYGGTGRALLRALREHGKAPAAIVELHPRRLGNTHPRRARDRAPGARAAPRDLPLVVSVAGADARGQIRAELARMGYRETLDYVCARESAVEADPAQNSA